MRRWGWVLPTIGILVVGAIPLVRYAQKSRTESAAAELLRELHVAQEGFRKSRNGSGGYATALESLLQPCPGATFRPLTPTVLASLRAAGYEVQVRSAEGATSLDADCHGRPTTSNYYAATAPRSIDSAGQQAFAVTATGRIYVFFDGVAPLERDMAPGGLATPLESVPTFKIP